MVQASNPRTIDYLSASAKSRQKPTTKQKVICIISGIFGTIVLHLGNFVAGWIAHTDPAVGVVMTIFFYPVQISNGWLDPDLYLSVMGAGLGVGAAFVIIVVRRRGRTNG